MEIGFDGTVRGGEQPNTLKVNAQGRGMNYLEQHKAGQDEVWGAISGLAKEFQRAGKLVAMSGAEAEAQTEQDYRADVQGLNLSYANGVKEINAELSQQKWDNVEQYKNAFQEREQALRERLFNSAQENGFRNFDENKVRLQESMNKWSLHANEAGAVQYVSWANANRQQVNDTNAYRGVEMGLGVDYFQKIADSRPEFNVSSLPQKNRAEYAAKLNARKADWVDSMAMSAELNNANQATSSFVASVYNPTVQQELAGLLESGDTERYNERVTEIRDKITENYEEQKTKFAMYANKRPNGMSEDGKKWSDHRIKKGLEQLKSNYETSMKVLKLNTKSVKAAVAKNAWDEAKECLNNPNKASVATNADTVELLTSMNDLQSDNAGCGFNETDTTDGGKKFFEMTGIEVPADIATRESRVKYQQDYLFGSMLEDISNIDEYTDGGIKRMNDILGVANKYLNKNDFDFVKTEISRKIKGAKSVGRTPFKGEESTIQNEMISLVGDVKNWNEFKEKHPELYSAFEKTMSQAGKFTTEELGANWLRDRGRVDLKQASEQAKNKKVAEDLYKRLVFPEDFKTMTSGTYVIKHNANQSSVVFSDYVYGIYRSNGIKRKEAEDIERKVYEYSATKQQILVESQPVLGFPGPGMSMNPVRYKKRNEYRLPNAVEVNKERMRLISQFKEKGTN